MSIPPFIPLLRKVAKLGNFLIWHLLTVISWKNQSVYRYLQLWLLCCVQAIPELIVFCSKSMEDHLTPKASLRLIP